MASIIPHRFIKWFLAATFTLAASFVIGTVGAHAEEPERNWTIYIAQAKHLDYNWCGTTTEVELRMAALMDFYLNQAEREAGRWNLDGTLWADVYRRHRGEEGLARLHRAIRNGGIGYGGNHSVLLWGILDTETAIRANYGAVPIENASGQPANTALVMENPAMTWGVANVLTSCGYDYLGRGIYSLRADSYLHNRQAYPLFWWKAPNGRRLLVHWDLYDSTKAWGGYAEAFRLMELRGARPDARRLQRLDRNDSPDVFQKRKQYIERTVRRYEGYGEAYPISSILLLGTGHDGWICSDDISRFIDQFNAESGGRIRLVDARLRDYFEAASKEIEEKDLEVPTQEGSFGICWEEWAAHMAGLVADFREAQRLLRLAEAAEAMRTAGLAGEVAFEGVRPHEREALIDHGFQQLLRFAEHDMGGIDRRLAAISAGVARTLRRKQSISVVRSPRDCQDKTRLRRRPHDRRISRSRGTADKSASIRSISRSHRSSARMGVNWSPRATVQPLASSSTPDTRRGLRRTPSFPKRWTRRAHPKYVVSSAIKYRRASTSLWNLTLTAST